MRLAINTPIMFTYVKTVSAAASPANLASRNCARPTGLDKTASAVPLRISRASDDDALKTAPNRPDNSITARTEFSTSFGSSPNAK